MILTCEHRAARAPEPITLELVSTPEGHQAHLEVRSARTPDPSASLSERALLVVQGAAKPISRKALRETLRVNNQRLGEALQMLKQQGAVVQTDSGWMAVRATPPGHQQADPSNQPLIDSQAPGQCNLPI